MDKVKLYEMARDSFEQNWESKEENRHTLAMNALTDQDTKSCKDIYIDGFIDCYNQLNPTQNK